MCVLKRRKRFLYIKVLNDVKFVIANSGVLVKF